MVGTEEKVGKVLDISSFHQMGPLATLFSTLPRNFRTTPLPRSYHGRQLPATEGEGQCPLLAECGHRYLESREGGRCPSHHGPGKFPSRVILC